MELKYQLPIEEILMNFKRQNLTFKQIAKLVITGFKVVTIRKYSRRYKIFFMSEAIDASVLKAIYQKNNSSKITSANALSKKWTQF